MTSERELLAAIEDGESERALAALRQEPELADARDAEGISALMQALYRGQQEVATALQRTKAELDVFEAAAVGEAEQLGALLDGDPSLVSSWSPDGFTPLHFAAFFDRPAAARLLIDRGAELEAASRNEVFAREARPLHSGAAAQAYEACAVMLEAGADPNARQHGGYTPLLEAAQNGDARLAELFLRHGADPSARLADGRDPSELAARAGAKKLAERLRTAG